MGQLVSIRPTSGVASVVVHLLQPAAGCARGMAEELPVAPGSCETPFSFGSEE